ncbi:MAG: serine protease [Candidatus Marinimicrobia bacterium]|jgi:S1-C subfamily serine protease|nr:serine protease [Candidatus Neomarinimicrobiota bacterium]MDP6935994.1 serine protease [Candidatus Neomarinimicrobiota bacterium]
MKKFLLILPFLYLLGTACAPYVKYQHISQQKPSKAAEYNISVYHELDPLPPHTIVLGEVTIDNAVPSVVNCSYKDVIRLAKWKARKVGGDAIHITQINLPDESNSCYGVNAKIIAFDPLAQMFWPSINLDENDFRDYYHSNVLDAIEGIWTISENTNWENVLTGVKGNNEVAGKYEVAIIRDDDAFNRYNAYVLHSKEAGLKRGQLKAYYTKSGYKQTYNEHWFMADQSELVRNIILEDSGIFRTTSKYSKYPVNYERENLSLKVYPPHYMTAPGLSMNTQLKTMGSGFVISGNGLIITNYHVIQGKETIEVYFPSIDKHFSAKIVLEDKNNDIALLALDEFHISEYFTEDIPFIISNTKNLRLGQEIFTLGYPLGEILGKSVKLSTGDVSSLYGIQDDPRLIQISNPIQPGNSGGPLLNENGEIVGVVLSTLNARYFYENESIIPQNVNFAIKGNYVSNLISILPEYQELSKRKNLLMGKSLEEQIELITPFIVTVK